MMFTDSYAAVVGLAMTFAGLACGVYWWAGIGAVMFILAVMVMFADDKGADE